MADKVFPLYLLKKDESLYSSHVVTSGKSNNFSKLKEEIQEPHLFQILVDILSKLPTSPSIHCLSKCVLYTTATIGLAIYSMSSQLTFEITSISGVTLIYFVNELGYPELAVWESLLKGIQNFSHTKQVTKQSEEPKKKVKLSLIPYGRFSKRVIISFLAA
ncbi:hypothetical protein Tco_1361814 [Tanacetum coccineum]